MAALYNRCIYTGGTDYDLMKTAYDIPTLKLCESKYLTGASY